MKQLENQRIKFWFIIWMFIVLPFLVCVYISPRPKCLKTETKTSLETYYDFNESGSGVWQAPETKTICVEWESK